MRPCVLPPQHRSTEGSWERATATQPLLSTPHSTSMCTEPWLTQLPVTCRGSPTRLATGDSELLEVFRAQWERECSLVPARDFDLVPVPWDDVVLLLPEVADTARVITDNSRSLERLNFDDHDPRVIVAVGGNTLSRGLTLEGLAVSFFVRSASAYDTLLQMGRWFGYRTDTRISRIWMTEEMRGVVPPSRDR